MSYFPFSSLTACNQGDHNSIENKAAVPIFYTFLFAEMVTVVAVFYWEYDASGARAANAPTKSILPRMAEPRQSP